MRLNPNFVTGRAKPEFDYQGVDQKTDPERNAKELARRQMSQRSCSEEHSHDRPGCCNAEQDNDGSQHPAPLLPSFSVLLVLESSPEREEKQCVEEQDSRALRPASNGKRAHSIRSDAHDSAKRKDNPLCHGGDARAAEEIKRDYQHKGQSGKDMGQSESGVRSKSCIQAG